MDGAWAGGGQREGWGARRLSCLPKEDVSHLSLDARSTNSQEAPPVLPVPPRTRAQLTLLTSWDGAPSPGSSLSGALNHSERRWDVGGGGGEGQGTGSGPTASERQGLLPPRPHLVTWEGRKERVSPRSGDLRGCFHNGPSGGRTLNGQLVSFSAVEMPPCPQAHRTLGPSQGEGGWDRAGRGVSPRALLGRKGAQSGLSFPL